MQRASGEFRQEIKRDAKADQREPDKNEIVGEPGINRHLRDAAHGPRDEEEIGRRVNPREPEQRRQQKPVRRIKFAFAPLAERGDGGNGDEQERGEEQHRASARKFEPRKPGAVAEQNGGDTDEHAEVPEVRGDDGQKRQGQFRLAQARKNPEHHAETGGNAEAVKQRVVGGGLDAAVGQQRAIGKQVRLVKSHHGGQRQQKADDEPEYRAAEEREQRHTAGGVNFLRTVWFGLSHSNGLGFAGARARAPAFSCRAIKPARAGAGFCQA